jgi:hypothetical protein
MINTPNALAPDEARSRNRKLDSSIAAKPNLNDLVELPSAEAVIDILTGGPRRRRLGQFEFDFIEVEGGKSTIKDRASLKR